MLTTSPPGHSDLQANAAKMRMALHKFAARRAGRGEPYNPQRATCPSDLAPSGAAARRSRTATAILDIQICNGQRIGFNEFAAGLDLVSH